MDEVREGEEGKRRSMEWSWWGPAQRRMGWWGSRERENILVGRGRGWGWAEVGERGSVKERRPGEVDAEMRREVGEW